MEPQPAMGKGMEAEPAATRSASPSGMPDTGTVLPGIRIDTGSSMLDPLAAYRRMREPRRARNAAQLRARPHEDSDVPPQEAPRTPTVQLLQNRAHLMTEDWGGAVQPLVGLGRAEDLNDCIAVAEEDPTQLVREAQGRMVPKRKRVLARLAPPKHATQKRAESWSLGPGWGEGKLGREGLHQRREDWEAAKFPNYSTMGREVRRHQRQSIEMQTNTPLKIRQRPKDPSAGRRLPTHLKTTGRCPTPDGMVGRTTRLLRAGSSSVGMTADQMERRRQGQKERLAIRERRKNPGPPWERDLAPDEVAPRSHGIARTRIAARAIVFTAATSSSPLGGRISTDW